MKLAGSATLFTAFGDDEVGHRCTSGSRSSGCDVEGGFRPEPQRRAFVHVDDPGERTITVLGPRLGPHGADSLDWDRLDGTDAVYLTAGDVERREPRAPRGVLVATPRGLDTLRRRTWSSTRSCRAAATRASSIATATSTPCRGWWCARSGAHGGEWETASGERGRWGPAGCPVPVRDAYGAGDSFAAGLTYGLGAGWEIDRAVELAARCGAACMTGSGPYEGQLEADVKPPGRRRLDRKPVRHPRLQTAVKVVGVVAGGRERLRRERRAAAGAAVEDHRPVTVDRPGLLGQPVELDVSVSSGIRPASRSYGSRTSTSCAPSRCSSATRAGERSSAIAAEATRLGFSPWIGRRAERRC